MTYRYRIGADEDDEPRLRMGRLLEEDERLIRRLFRTRRNINKASSPPIRQPPTASRAFSCTRVHQGLRTFHMRLTPCDRGSRLVLYTHRLDGASRSEELESASDIGDFPLQAILRERLHRERQEWKAPAYHLILELPLTATAAAARSMMTKVSGLFSARGVPTVWAVHRTNQSGALQVHGHIVLLATDNASGQVMRPIEGSQAMGAFRQAVAAIINETAAEYGIELEAQWHGGGFADIGLPRVPRERLPMALYKAREDRNHGKPQSKARRKLALAADRIEAAYHRRTMPAATPIAATKPITRGGHDDR